jgi:dephospho-CoA kinase
VAATLMLRVALTGGIGTGKSRVRARFQTLGVPAIDADAIVHESLRPGTAVTAGIVERFGAGVLAPAGGVDRRKLGAIVFADTAARRSLERLVHPVVFAAIDAWFASLPADAGPRWALADVPLLYETGCESWFDKVIVAACSPEEQVRRVAARDALDDAAARARVAAQQPIGEKASKADYVVWTDAGFDDADRQVDEIYRLLTALASASL